MKCLKIDKNYVIPTIKWLIPISELVDGLIILSNLIKKEKVLVKITQKKIVDYDRNKYFKSIFNEIDNYYGGIDKICDDIKIYMV